MLLLLSWAVIPLIHGLHFKGPNLHQLTPTVDHGEGPAWDPRTQTLYFVDIHNGKVLCYDYNKQDITDFLSFPGKDVAPVLITKQDTNTLVVGLNRTVAIVHRGNSNHSTPNVLSTVQENLPNSRFNDGKADSKGRLWIGTMGYETKDRLEPNGGALYKITRENLQNPEVMISPVNVSNGMAWNKNNDKFYYIDTPTQQIVVYDYDEEEGKISNRKVAFDLKKNGIDCYPDGMTIDKDDNLWVALYGGGSVIKVNPTNGTLLERIPIPATYVTSVSWGGPELDTLFVTTSKYVLNKKELLQQPGAGSLYAITNLNTKGLPAYEVDIY